jgi:hypothetical protein
MKRRRTSKGTEERLWRKLENDPRFLKKVALARQQLKEGKGVRLEDLDKHLISK